jgi:hypothetical protein
MISFLKRWGLSPGFMLLPSLNDSDPKKYRYVVFLEK